MSRARPATWPTALVCGAVLATAAGCSGTTAADEAGAGTSSAAAALSSAAQASPGAYGTPADPSMPNPTSVATDPAAAPTTGGGAGATVVITYADWDTTTATLEVGAYVQGVVESGGTCTATATGPGVAAVSAAAEPDAGTTSCPGLSLSADDLGRGTWDVVVSYASGTTTGRSTSSTVVVP